MMTREEPTIATAFPKADLRPRTGPNDLAVAEAVARPGTRPERVTHVLTALYQTIAAHSVSQEIVRRLPCGTREWLLQQAAHTYQPAITWFEGTCSHCGGSYDLSLELTGAVKHTPDGPLTTVIEVETSIGHRSFLLPNGSHEEAFAHQAQDQDPQRAFAALCSQSADAADEAQQFTQRDLKLIDEALEAASPDIADEVQTTCPSCGQETRARIDPLLFAFPLERDILQQTHTIAMAYGWPLDQILRLSARHRSFFATSISGERRAAGSALGWRAT